MFPVVADTTKVRIFKQITTVLAWWTAHFKLLLIPQRYEFSSKSQQLGANAANAGGCCWYHKGTNFQANHNYHLTRYPMRIVVADTTKVRIFKQITTANVDKPASNGCCWYHKGTNFQANHNTMQIDDMLAAVVADTTKVRIFKQITTARARI